jgi:hypothetical protein
MLLTAADLGDTNDSWLPASHFKLAKDENNNTVWQGTLNDIEITIISAAVGKPYP